ncbi:hypothetical protein Lser_V15G37783 [Lactuca serriola]
MGLIPTGNSILYNSRKTLPQLTQICLHPFSKNYDFWKTMIQSFLITNNLFQYVDGSLMCPSQTLPGMSTDAQPKIQPNPDYATWILNDSTITEASFPHVPKDIWFSLAHAYAPQSISTEYTLKAQLLKIEMQPEESISTYLSRAKEYEYAEALANIGEPIKEKDLVIFVVSGLRDEYNGLKSNLIA